MPAYLKEELGCITQKDIDCVYLTFSEFYSKAYTGMHGIRPELGQGFALKFRITLLLSLSQKNASFFSFISCDALSYAFHFQVRVNTTIASF